MNGVLILFFSFFSFSYASVPSKGWIFSPMAGINQPALEVVYDKVFNSPFVGTSDITTDLPEDVEGRNTYPSERFFFENPMKAPDFGFESGIELRRNFGLKNDFIIGISTWEVSSEAVTVATFPLQGRRNNRAQYDRRAKFSYTQFYLGLRRYLFERKKRSNLYANFTVHEMFDIDYEETNVFSFLTGAPAGFRRIIRYQSQATGLMMLQFGGGAEFRFADRFSIGLEGGYAFTLVSGTLKGVKLINDLNNGDRLSGIPSPISDNSAGVTRVLESDGRSVSEVKLRLDGWRALVKLNIAF